MDNVYDTHKVKLNQFTQYPFFPWFFRQLWISWFVRITNSLFWNIFEWENGDTRYKQNRMDKNSLKKELFKACLDFVEQRAATVNEIMASNQKSLESETKSSAGDKHETGRAMLQLEMEKASQQLLFVEQMKDILRKIDIEDRSNSAIQGSLVITTSGKYFLAIGLGTVNIGSE